MCEGFEGGRGGAAAHSSSTEPGSRGWVEARPEDGGSDRSARRPPTSWYLRWRKAAAPPSARLRPDCPRKAVPATAMRLGHLDRRWGFTRAVEPRPYCLTRGATAHLRVPSQRLSSTATQVSPAKTKGVRRALHSGEQPGPGDLAVIRMRGVAIPGELVESLHMDRQARQRGGAAGKSARTGGDLKPTAQTAASRCRPARKSRAGGVRGQHTPGRPSMRHRATLRHGPPPGARSPPFFSTPPHRRRHPHRCGRGCFA